MADTHTQGGGVVYALWQTHTHRGEGWCMHYGRHTYTGGRGGVFVMADTHTQGGRGGVCVQAGTQAYGRGGGGEAVSEHRPSGRLK